MQFRGQFIEFAINQVIIVQQQEIVTSRLCETEIEMIVRYEWRLLFYVADARAAIALDNRFSVVRGTVV